MKKHAFLENLLGLAKLRGWRRAHFRPAKTSRGWRTAVQADGKGFPDLFLVRPRPRSVLVAEPKLLPNCVMPDQEQWLANCEAVGVPTVNQGWNADEHEATEPLHGDGVPWMPAAPGTAGSHRQPGNVSQGYLEAVGGQSYGHRGEQHDQFT